MRERWQKFLEQGDKYGDQWQRPGEQWSREPGDEWQQYVDYYLMGSGAFGGAAILDSEGTTLAASPGFQVSPKQAYVVGELLDGGAPGARDGSVTLGEHTYADLGVDGRTLYGSRGAGQRGRVLGRDAFVGFLAARSATALVIGAHVEGQPRDDAARVLDKFVDRLVKKGL
ncbi:profilin [Streptomyces sp. G45]|uniref:profilin n=1 Tax=Streptomyces sp. G45 TaxID=3406627 RepID=UPI003C18438B